MNLLHNTYKPNKRIIKRFGKIKKHKSKKKRKKLYQQMDNLMFENQLWRTMEFKRDIK